MSVNMNLVIFSDIWWIRHQLNNKNKRIYMLPQSLGICRKLVNDRLDKNKIWIIKKRQFLQRKQFSIQRRTVQKYKKNVKLKFEMYYFGINWSVEHLASSKSIQVENFPCKAEKCSKYFGIAENIGEVSKPGCAV